MTLYAPQIFAASFLNKRYASNPSDTATGRAVTKEWMQKHIHMVMQIFFCYGEIAKRLGNADRRHDLLR